MFVRNQAIAINQSESANRTGYHILMNKKFAVVAIILPVMLSTAMTGPAVADTPSASSSAGNKLDKAALNKFATNLHQIHSTVAKIKRASQELNNEFNRTSLQIITFDEYINKYIDGKQVPYDEQLYPYGFQNIGNTSTTAGAPLPPRKNYIEHSADQMNSLCELLQQEIDNASALIDSAGSDSSLARMKDSLAKAKSTLTDRIKVMTALSLKEPYDKDAIGNTATVLTTELAELDTTCKLLFKMALASTNK